MNQVWKFPVRDEVLIPGGSTFLKVDLQGQHTQMWWQVDPEALPVVYRFKVVGTGHGFNPKVMSYLGTWQDGSFVWHLYQIT